MCSNYDNKVIGSFAYASRTEVFCTGDAGDACVIFGSQQVAEDYLKELDPDGWKKNTIKKTRFGEILNGLQLGAAYAFDEESYARFYPLARKEGLAVDKGNFKKQKSEGFPFFTVQIKSG